MHTTKKVKVKPSPELDALAVESGRLYSKVVSYARKFTARKVFGCPKMPCKSA